MVRVVFLLSIVDENELVHYHNMKKNDIIDGENKTINKDKQKRSSSRKTCFCVRLLKNKWFVLASILFILTLVILVVVLIEGNDLINKLKNNLQIKESFISERENQTNQTVKQLKNELSEKNATIEQLNKKLEERNKERSRINNHW
jgi:sensor histidine kinase YesM